MTKRYCLRGHDTEVVGRNKDSFCRECQRVGQRLWSAAHPEYTKARSRAQYLAKIGQVETNRERGLCRSGRHVLAEVGKVGKRCAGCRHLSQQRFSSRYRESPKGREARRRWDESPKARRSKLIYGYTGRYTLRTTPLDRLKEDKLNGL